MCTDTSTRIQTIAATDMEVGKRYRGTFDGPSELAGVDFTLEAITWVDQTNASDSSDTTTIGTATVKIRGHETTSAVTFSLLDAVTHRPTFEPAYTPTDSIRIQRERLYLDGGAATVTFRGQVADATACWVDSTSSGRLALFAEVAVDDSTATAITVAVVPTGKRAPAIDEHSRDTASVRLGSVRGQHVYLLAVDGTVDRAAFEAERATARAQRQAEREAAEAAERPYIFGG